MDHLRQTKQEFTRQAAGFAASAATTDSRLTQRLIEAAGASATQLALDVACGPGIVTAALARNVQEVVAFDLTVGRKNTVRRFWRCQVAGVMLLLRWMLGAKGLGVLRIEAGCRAFMTRRQVRSGLLQGSARNASIHGTSF